MAGNHLSRVPRQYVDISATVLRVSLQLERDKERGMAVIGRPGVRSMSVGCRLISGD